MFRFLWSLFCRRRSEEVDVKAVFERAKHLVNHVVVVTVPDLDVVRETHGTWPFVLVSGILSSVMPYTNRNNVMDLKFTLSDVGLYGKPLPLGVNAELTCWSAREFAFAIGLVPNDITKRDRLMWDVSHLYAIKPDRRV